MQGLTPCVRQALSETRNPVRTLKIAAPMAIGSVGIFYMLCNIAYFAAVPKDQFLSSGQTVAATFFGNMFGARAEKVMSVFVALSAFGNVLSVIFSQGRSTFVVLLCWVVDVETNDVVQLFRSWVVKACCPFPRSGLAIGRSTRLLPVCSSTGSYPLSSCWHRRQVMLITSWSSKLSLIHPLLKRRSN